MRKSPPPVVDGWFVAEENSSPATDTEVVRDNSPAAVAKQERRHNLFQSRVAQRDVVTTIALLMREKSYAPYLKTNFEAAYAKGLKALVKKDGLETFKSGDPLPPQLEGREVNFDKITGLPVQQYSPVTIPYTRESRDEIRAAAAQWITEHP